MKYPPKPHQENAPDKIEALMRNYPFAHLFSTNHQRHNVTRLPFILDTQNGTPQRLRAHMNAQNLQAETLDGSDVLVAFSGPDSYVSPNWRTDSKRGATWDYTAVHVWGRAKLRTEREFFKKLITDLAAAAEPNFKGISDLPDWSYDTVTTEYVDRLFPHLVSFEIEIEDIKAISKLHQDFPKEDAASVADHMAKSDNPQSQAVASLIKQRLDDKP